MIGGGFGGGRSIGGRGDAWGVCDCFDWVCGCGRAFLFYDNGSESAVLWRGKEGEDAEGGRIPGALPVS